MNWLNQSGYVVTDLLFWRRCSDWILTVRWPWAVLAISTKQYVRTYHETRHKSLSPRQTLNQVLVSGWEKGAAVNQQGQKERPSSPHNYICQENYQVGKCKQKIQKVFIKLSSGGVGRQSLCTAHVYFSPRIWIWIFNMALDFSFVSNTVDVVTCAGCKLFCNDYRIIN